MPPTSCAPALRLWVLVWLCHLQLVVCTPVDSCRSPDEQAALTSSLVQQDQVRRKQPLHEAPDKLRLANDTSELASLIAHTAAHGEVPALFAVDTSAGVKSSQPGSIHEQYTVDIEPVPADSDLLNSSQVIVVEPQDDGSIGLPDYLPTVTADGRNITYVIVPAQLVPKEQEQSFLDLVARMLVVLAVLVVLCVALIWCLYKIMGVRNDSRSMVPSNEMKSQYQPQYQSYTQQGIPFSSGSGPPTLHQVM